MDEDRPYAPSARKLKRAREAGEVARSPLASAALVLLAAGAAIAFAGPAWLDAWRGFATRALSGEGTLEEAAGIAALGLAPPLTAAVVVGAFASFLQVGPLFTVRPLVPDLGRLAPGRALARWFSPPVLAARLAPLLLVAAIVAIALLTLRDGAGLLGRTALAPDAALEAAGAILGAFFLRACGALALAGAIALVWHRWRHWVEQHMSRREVLREQRELEGEPGARHRRERIGRALVVAPTLAEALSRTTLVVRGEGLAVLVAWDGSESAPTMQYVLRGATDAVPPAIPRAADAILAAELAVLPPGARAPRRTWARLARWITRSDA